MTKPMAPLFADLNVVAYSHRHRLCAHVHALRLIMGLLLAHPGWTSAQERPDIQEGSAQPDWHEQAKKEGLTSADIDRLAIDKLRIGAQEFKQSFDPYVQGGNLPQFITSDSVLNGFHVLFEETFRRFERANARRLPDLLCRLWECLGCCPYCIEGRPDLIAAAQRRARIVLGVALRLLGRETSGIDDETESVIDAEARKVIAAREVSMPPFLGPPRPDMLGLDYARFRPRGFYEDDEEMCRYFRTVAWLQAVPFRLEDDEELLAFMLLNCPLRDPAGFCGDRYLHHELEQYLDRLHDLIGSADAADLTLCLGTIQTRITIGGKKDDLARWREWLRGRTEWEAARGDQDQWRLPPQSQRQGTGRTMRVLPSLRTPEGALFLATTDPRLFRGRDLPSGMEVAVALGSRRAREFLGGQQRAGLLHAIDSNPIPLGDRSFYSRYLLCLHALVDEPEPDAPALMRSSAWQCKSVNTLLGSWAQMRHSLILQAQESVVYGGMVETPAGLIEPDPEFFARLGRLVGILRGLFSGSGAFSPDWHLAAKEVRAALASIGDEKKAQQEARGGPWIPVNSLVHWLLPRTPWYQGFSWDEIEHTLGSAIARLDKGLPPEDERLADALSQMQVDIEPLWEQLELMCVRLEALSHKQLRGLHFSVDEEDFIRSYGEKLANIMLYGGNSWLMPNDDAPRIADPASNPGKGLVLEVGIGRPRALYVLYPWKGREMLCRGSVVTYFEFAHAGRLSDAEWRTLLDSPDRPEPPNWLQPLLGESPMRTDPTGEQ